MAQIKIETNCSDFEAMQKKEALEKIAKHDVKQLNFIAKVSQMQGAIEKLEKNFNLLKNYL